VERKCDAAKMKTTSKKNKKKRKSKKRLGGEISYLQVGVKEVKHTTLLRIRKKSKTKLKFDARKVTTQIRTHYM
jgi:hypothetical protein